VTFADCATDIARQLADAGAEAGEAARDAELLLRHCLRWEAADWLAHRTDPAPATIAAAVMPLVARRAAREPMAYITGEREFWGRAFAVTPDVLVPRPETEGLIEAALAWRTAERQAPRVIDVGTGSGCLAVSLALEWPDAHVWATDVSAGALATARRNAERHGVAGRLTWARGGLFAGLAGAFDLVVSNPPYVPDRDRATLPPEVADHEPAAALFGGPEGLDVIARLLEAAPGVLGSGGRLLVEIGFGQAEAVRALVQGVDALTLVDIRPDLQGIPRVLVADRT
jgi:release factor glutamine methyltransferase